MLWGDAKENYKLATYFYFMYLFILQPCLRHMEVPKLEVKLGLQLQAYTTTMVGNTRSEQHL